MKRRRRYVAGRLIWAAVTVLFVMTLNFFIFRILPGDPARAGFRDPRLNRDAQAALQERFGLDKPVINCFEQLNPIKTGNCGVNPLETQFFIYFSNLLQGDMGVSYHSNRPVRVVLLERLWNTVLLIGVGQILAIAIGTLLGIVSAWKSRTPLDYVTLLFSLITWSLPTFWLGIILLFWGSRNYALPVGGKLTPGLHADSFSETLSDLARHMILPTLTFAIVVLGQYVLIMRSTLLDVLSQDYILTAKAKGLSNFRILRTHALRNAMLPMVTLIALNLGFTVAGAIQIEAVFSWPGLGSAIFEAVGRRDYPLLQGAFLLIAVSVILANLLADLAYSVLDPRIQDNA